jgi:hypothetical protein
MDGTVGNAYAHQPSFQVYRPHIRKLHGSQYIWYVLSWQIRTCVDVGQHDANCQADEKPDPGTNGVEQRADGRTAIAVLYAEYQHRLEG